MRKPFQGTWNIIRFNWPFYVLSLGFAFLMLLIRNAWSSPISLVAGILFVLVITLTAFSLVVSWCVYDRSRLYELSWLDGLHFDGTERIVNINAGFDETSNLLADRFEGAEFIVCDFYDPAQHTESSIKRARKAYPPFPGTRKMSTNQTSLTDDSADKVFVILSAHEIRDDVERHSFFCELKRVLSPSGQIIVVEHLRDTANFLAYNVGAFHFQSRSAWLRTFAAARLNVESEVKITPFISVFFLNKNGIES